MEIAIIGMAGRFPEASNVIEFYRNLCEGKDSVRELSLKRKKNTTIPLNADYSLLGWIDDVDIFDHEFFNISLKEAQYMDPHQRLLMEVVYETFENAGYNADKFKGSNTAIFIGDTNLNYHRLSEEFDPTSITGNMNAVVAGRIARFFGLRGSALMIDTTCSSSLVALHYAVQDLINGDADCAVVCGVNLDLHPVKNVNYDIGITSIDGKARAFSAEANGTIGGEAVCSVLLKPLDKAILDKDNIHAVIKGSAINQDADLSGSLTAPSSLAQAEVIKKAWRKANIDPNTISYIETHGTGTKLGDPIEIQGISLAFKDFTERKNFCAISSVKTNVGHANTAAGLVGLIKAVLSLKSKQLFPSLHFKTPNRFIDFSNSPVYVNDTLKEWKVNGEIKRRAGISSFGLSGTNCHVILEEAPTFNNDTLDASERFGNSNVVTITGKSLASLRYNTDALKKYLLDQDTVSLNKLSYTLNCARKHYEYKFALVVNSINGLISALESGSEKIAEIKKSIKVDKTIFVFSNDLTVSKEVLKLCCAQNSTFNSLYKTCLKKADQSYDDLNFYEFAFKYCFYKTLEHFGITSQFVVGDGLGEIVISVITTKLSLEEGINKVLITKKFVSNNIGKRCASLVKKLENERVVFVEMGLPGSISNTLTKLKNEKSNYDVVHFNIGEKDPFNHLIKDLFLLNHPISWSDFHKGYSASRLEIPSYEFQKTRCWIKENSEDNVEDWCYHLNWEIVKKETNLLPFNEEVFLIILNPTHLNREIKDKMRASFSRVFFVMPGSSFDVINDNTIQIVMEEEESYKRLFNFINSQKIKIAGIINLLSFEENEVIVKKENYKEFYSHFYLFRSFDELFSTEKIKYIILTCNARKITESQDHLNPESSLAHGLVTSLIKEYPLLQAKCIDVDTDFSSLLDHILIAECNSLDEKLIVAYRNGNRYQPKIKKIKFPSEHKRLAGEVIKEQGVYLITGGGSGIGLEVAKFLADVKKVTLIILGRRDLSEKSESGLQERDQAALAVFKSLRERGHEVIYYAINLEDREKLRVIIDEVRAKCGKINGVVHSAGVPGKKRLKNHSLESYKETLYPKVDGAVNLYGLIKDPLDFFILFSANNSLIGSEKNTNYGAANAFLDNYVDKLCMDGVKAKVINWCGWAGTGMLHRVSSFMEDNRTQESLLSIQEGIKAFALVLSSDSISNVIISKDNPKYLGPNPYFLLDDDLEHYLQLFDNTPFDSSPKNVIEKKEQSLEEIENVISNIWRSALNISKIQPNDDFFELGGHSLNGAQVVSKMEKEFNLEIEFDIIFEHSTIRSLASYIKDLNTLEIKLDMKIN
jgi:acyl transferase domain-containing protein/acyl carrier protein